MLRRILAYKNNQNIVVIWFGHWSSHRRGSLASIFFHCSSFAEETSRGVRSLIFIWSWTRTTTHDVILFNCSSEYGTINHAELHLYPQPSKAPWLWIYCVKQAWMSVSSTVHEGAGVPGLGTWGIGSRRWGRMSRRTGSPTPCTLRHTPAARPMLYTHSSTVSPSPLCTRRSHHLHAPSKFLLLITFFEKKQFSHESTCINIISWVLCLSYYQRRRWRGASVSAAQKLPACTPWP
jgi:hypothetical protein